VSTSTLSSIKPEKIMVVARNKSVNRFIFLPFFEDILGGGSIPQIMVEIQKLSCNCLVLKGYSLDQNSLGSSKILPLIEQNS
jgi:hypothetical protein